MQPLLPIIKTALNRLQPPPKHAQSSLLLLLLLMLLLLSHRLLLPTDTWGDLHLLHFFCFLSEFQPFFGSISLPPEAAAAAAAAAEFMSPELHSWTDRGMRKTKLKYKRWWWTGDYDRSLHPTNGSAHNRHLSLAAFVSWSICSIKPHHRYVCTHKTHKKTQNTAQKHNSWFTCGSVFGFLMDTLPSWLYTGCSAHEADIFEARGRRHTATNNIFIRLPELILYL